jgi:hypothetical protein
MVLLALQCSGGCTQKHPDHDTKFTTLIIGSRQGIGQQAGDRAAGINDRMILTMKCSDFPIVVAPYAAYTLTD